MNILKRLKTYKPIKYILPAAVVFLLFVSCEEKTYWDLKPENKTYLIVDGILTNENKHQTIFLTLSNQDINQAVNFAEGAAVSVFDGENEYLFTESDSGVYISENSFSGVVNKTYELLIEYNGRQFTARAGMLPVSVSSPLPYAQAQDTNLYYISADHAVFNPNESYMAEVLLDWSEVNGYDTVSASETKARLLFYNLQTIDVNQIFSPDNERVLFPAGTHMIQRKYSLTLDHERFIRSLLAETHWHGGNFDLEEGNVYTNLSEGALGFFAACSVIADTSLVQ